MKLPVRAKFGDKIVAARQYRLSVRDGRLSLADATTMVTVATLQTTVSETEESMDPPEVSVSNTKTKVVLTLHNRNRIYRAEGIPTSDKDTAPADVALRGKKEMTLDKGIPKQKTERELVVNAIKRYASSVKHCAEKARKHRWDSGDPRYVRCACPLTTKWRLPKVTETMKVHYVLAKGRSGITLTVNEKGRAAACDVWVGKEPPKDLSPKDPAKAANATPKGNN